MSNPAQVGRPLKTSPENMPGNGISDRDKRREWLRNFFDAVMAPDSIPGGIIRAYSPRNSND